MTKDKQSIFSRDIVVAAIGNSFLKLDPRTLVRNPVIFIVEIGSVVTTAIFFRDLVASDDTEPLWFTGSVALWLWLTVLFANFAEAIAEGRGKAQANALRATRTTTVAYRRSDTGGVEEVPASELKRGDVVVVEAGQIIPADGEIIEGVGSVDESAITGESAPVIREAGGDRSAVTGRDASAFGPARDRGHPGAWTVLPRPHDRARRGRRTTQDAKRDRTQHPPRSPDDHVRRRNGDVAAVRHLRGHRAVPDRPHRFARRPDPHDHRSAALGNRHRGDGPARSAKRPGDVGTRGRGLR